MTRLQNAALRKVMGAVRGSSGSKVEAIAAVEDVETFARASAGRFLARTMCDPGRAGAGSVDGRQCGWEAAGGIRKSPQCNDVFILELKLFSEALMRSEHPFNHLIIPNILFQLVQNLRCHFIRQLPPLHRQMQISFINIGLIGCIFRYVDMIRQKDTHNHRTHIRSKPGHANHDAFEAENKKTSN